MKDDKNNQLNIKVDNSTVIRVLFIVLLGLLAFSVLDKVVQPLILILISFFLAIGLNPTVSWISRRLKNGSRTLATGVAYIIVVAFLTTFFSLVFPPIVRQTIDFLKEVPDTIQDVRRDNETVKNIIEKYKINEEVDQFTNDLGARVGDLGKPALSAAGKVGETLASIVIVFVLTFMMLVEGPTWFSKYIKTLKPDKRERQKELAKKMYKVIVGYVNGQVIIAVLGGFFATLALVISSQILDVTVNSVALGGIVALFALLPLIGTTIGAILVILSTLIVSWPLALIMAIYFVIYQQIENVTIQPFIQSRSSSMTPLLVIISALLGVALGGILGALLAIPAAGCIKVIVDDYLVRKRKVA
jgi:predicted PurR-regulated permease PerM